MAEETEEYLHIPGHVTIKKAADMLGISYMRTFQHVQSGRLQSKKVGGRHMIPEQAIEDFKRYPPGRMRVDPVDWRTYDSPVSVLSVELEVRLIEGQQAIFEQKVAEMYMTQQHRIAGTMFRLIAIDEADAGVVKLLLVWKSNEMPNEATIERDLAAFKAEFADVLMWETAIERKMRVLLLT